MAEKATPMTKDGIERLEKELEHLRAVRRPEVADRIHQAKELASAQNNAEYEEAKNEQAFVEGRILTLEHLFLGGAPLPPPHGSEGIDPTPDGLSCFLRP